MAYLKLRTFLHADHVEVGGFGISAADDPLYLERFESVKQVVTAVSVEFDDGAVADHFDRCVDAGIGPARCGRVWLHSHPGDSPQPSATDEETFARAFGACDWGVMAIIARTGATYARLQFSAGPGRHVEIPVEVDWERFPKDLLELEGTLDPLIAGWMDEYGANVHPRATEAFGPTETVEVHPFDVFGGLYDERELDDDFAALFERHGDRQEVL